MLYIFMSLIMPQFHCLMLLLAQLKPVNSKEGDAKLDVNQLNPIPGILYKIPYSGATPQTSSVESFIGK